MLERPRGGDRAVLVNLDFGNVDFAESLEEIRRLAESADVKPVTVVKGRRQRPTPQRLPAPQVEGNCRPGTVDRRLACVVQSRSVAGAAAQSGKALQLPRDRPHQPDFDIFAQRARSHEGKLQVELAQLEHLSTRLVRGWTHLERQKAASACVAPGETQLETDRQLLRKRVKVLKDKLATVRRQRPDATPGAAARPGDVGVAGRLYQRRQIDAVNQLTDSDAYGRRPVVRHTGHDVEAHQRRERRRVVMSDTVDSSVTCARSGGSFQRHSGRDGTRRSAAARGGRRQPGARRPDRGS